MESTSEMGAAGLPLSSARRPVPADDEKWFAFMARTDFGQMAISHDLVETGSKLGWASMHYRFPSHHINKTRTLTVAR